MKITDIYVSSYGSLKNKRISFSDSVNIIEGENESGKSTLMAFVSFMLYGGNDDIDRIKSSDGKCGGTMTVFTEKHGSLQIQRYASVTGKRYSDTVQIYHLPSMQEINIKKPVGDYLLGVSKQFFSETAFISQKGASAYNSKNINDSIQNILLSAGESYNTEKAMKKLDEIRKFFVLKRGRGGIITELEDRKSELTAQANTNKENILRAENAKNELSQLTASKKRYQELISDIFSEKKARTAKKINDAKIELESKKVLLEEKKSELYEICEKCNEFSENNTKAKIRELDLKIKYDNAKIIDIESDIQANDSAKKEDLSDYSPESEKSLIFSVTSGRKKAKNLKYASYMSLTLFAICLVLTLIFAAGANVFLTLPIIILALTMVCTFFLFLSRKKQSEDAVSALLSKYGYSARTSISEIRSDFAKKAVEKREAENRVMQTAQKRELLNEIKNRRDSNSELLCNIISKVLDYKTVCEDAAVEKAEERISEYYIKLENSRNEFLLLSEHIEKLKNFLSSSDHELCVNAAPDPKYSEYTDTELDNVFKKANTEVNLLVEKILEKEKLLSVLQTTIVPSENYTERINDTENTLAERRKQLEIVHLAEESVKYASENIRSAVTPHLLAHGDRLFSAVTKEKYTGIGFTDDLSPNGANGDTLKKKSELSYGTNEAMYLSFRSALLLTLCKNELPPIMLDESFAHIDNARTLECIKLLSSSGLQTLVFTCNDREKRILTENEQIFSHILI